MLDSNLNKLMIPGPIDLEPDVLTTLNEQVIPHYGPEWVQIYTQARNGIRRYAETESDVFFALWLWQFWFGCSRRHLFWTWREGTG